MSTPAITNDTFYDDPCDQMSDYEDVLAESGGIDMAISLLQTEPEESGQSPHGIWGLFAIEAILSAAGSPSSSESCGFLREWGESLNFRPSPSLIMEMKEANHSSYAQEIIQQKFEKTGKWPLDRKSLVCWLTGKLDGTEVNYASPLECLFNPSILANSPESRNYPDQVKGEAYGALIEAVSKRSPTGLGKLLPVLNPQHAQLFSDSGPPDFRAIGDRVIEILFEEWTGIPREGSTEPLPKAASFPVDFWNEIKGLFTGEFAFPTHFTGRRYRFSIYFQALWSAWHAGDCTVETYSRIYTLERYKLFSNSFNQITERVAGDPRIIEFTKQHARNLTASIRKLIYECIRNEDWQNLNSLTYDYREKRGVEFLSIAAKKLLEGASIDDVKRLARVEVLNPDDDLDELRKHLRALPQKTLKQLLPHTRLALHIVMDLIEDRKFVDTFRVILGTFSEPLMPDTSDDFAEVCEITQVYHPGRSVCGTTDFNPFYEAISKCPKSVMEEIFKIVGNSTFSIVEGGSTRLKLYAGLPVKDKDADKDRPAIRALSRRLPADPAEQEQELNRRVMNLVAYVQEGDRPKLDFIFRWLLHQMRDAAYLWAEAANQPSWTEAAFDMARRSRCDTPLEFEGYTLKQSPQTHPGYAVAKKGKPLKSVPPAIAKAPEVRSFTHLAHFHRLMEMLLRSEFLSNQLITGEEPDVEFCNRHISTFQIDPRDWLRERAVLTLPDASREVIRKRIDYWFSIPTIDKFSPTTMSILPDFKISPAELFPRLAVSHWMWEYDTRSEVYEISPRLGCGVYLRFSIHRRGGIQKSGRLPTETFQLNLKYVGLDEKIGPNDPILDRAIDRVLQDLVLASSASEGGNPDD
ncbi:MAG: hypothetical protein WCS43_00515 [Verrucomicrobiota bacterium]